MRLVGERSRARLLDRLVKQNGWSSIAIVGVKDDLETKSLLQWCRKLELTVVWRVTPGAGRHELQRQGFARDRMVKWAGVYKRLTLLQMPSAEAVEQLAGQQFDAVALWGLTPAQLAGEGAKWAGLVRTGGMLVGMDHRVAECRRVLNAAVPKWRVHRDGVWMVDVHRSKVASDGVEDHAPDHAADIRDNELAVGVESLPPADDFGSVEQPTQSGIEAAEVVERDVTLSGVLSGVHEVDRFGDSEAVAGRDLALQRRDVTHDPINSGSDANETVHATAPAAGAERAGNVAQPAPKRRGRPPGTRNKAPGVATARGRKATA